jgi:hypothetical protein
VNRVPNHRAVDGHVVFRDEIGGCGAEDREQNRQRLDRHAMSQQREDGREQTEAGKQVRAQSQVVETISVSKPHRQLADVERITNRIQQYREADHETDVGALENRFLHCAQL